jgi:hypothetical protein
MTTLVLLSAAVMAITMLLMAVGVLVSNRCLRGSCGGPEVVAPDGTPLSCEGCPQREAQTAAAIPLRQVGAPRLD